MIPSPLAATPHTAAAALPVEVHGVRRPGRPTVVLVHGVGFGPEILGPVADRLAGRGEVAVVHRPGYGELADEPTAPVELQADRLAATLVALGHASGRAPVVAGVSGGATLGLALALAHPAVASAVVVHEPLVGPLAVDLHGIVRGAAARLAADPREHAACCYVADLVGASTWQALSYAERDLVAERAAVVRREVPAFVAFAPSEAALSARRGGPPPLVVSTGSRSPAVRHAAAAVVAELTGAASVVLPSCGHLAPVDAPAELSRLVDAVVDDVSVVR